MKRRLGSVLLAAALMSGMLPAYAVELTVEDTGTVIQSEADWADVSALVAAYEDDSFYGEITIDPQTNEVQKDQETISLQQEFEMTKQEEREILGSADAAEQYFEQQDTFETYTDDSGVVHVTEPYQTARLIVFADELDSDYGAEEVLYLEQYDEYILQFTQSADARNACEQLQSALGEENCFPDEMQTEDMLLAEDGLDTQSQESVSWGTEYMGLDQLQQQVDIYGLSDRHATVAVVDTGIDSDNSMFAGRSVTGYNFVSSSQQELDDMVDPKDCVSLDTSDYYDYDVRNGGGHGTHVAGIVADATSDNVEIMALRVFDAMGKSYYSLIISALQYADEHDADVVNLSLGI
ncbi:MAG: S8 family peptidase, partial [Butyricicoccaceae bacterium]